jgi:hypothetical protein
VAQIALARKVVTRFDTHKKQLLGLWDPLCKFPLPPAKAITCVQTFLVDLDIVVYSILDSLAKLPRALCHGTNRCFGIARLVSVKVTVRGQIDIHVQLKAALFEPIEKCP